MRPEDWTATAAWLALVVLAALADRRRHRRRDLDRVGWVPWPLVMIGAMLGAATSAALALHQ